jgi:hypothetical protein
MNFFIMFLNKKTIVLYDQQDILITPPIITTDFVYLRLIGDISIDERNFVEIRNLNND